MGDGSVNQFVEIVGKDFAGKTHGNTLRPLRKQKRKFDGQAHGLLVPAVIGKLPFRDFGAEHHVAGKGREAGFNVSGSRRGVSRQNIPPVPLGVDEQVFLAQAYQGVRDGPVPVRMEFHRIPDDIGYFIVAPVIQPVHGMQDAALNGLEPVIDFRHGPFQNNVGGVIQKVVGIHAFHGLARGCDVGGLSHGQKY